MATNLSTTKRPGRAVSTPKHSPGSVPRGGGSSTPRPGRPLPAGQLPQTPTRTTSGEPVRVTDAGVIVTGGGKISGGGRAFVQQSGNYQDVSGQIYQVDYSTPTTPTSERKQPGIVSYLRDPQGRSYTGEVGGYSTPEGEVRLYPVFGSGGLPKQNGVDALSANTRADRYVQRSNVQTVRGTGKRAIRSTGDFLSQTAVGDALPFLRTSSSRRERVESYAGSRIDSAIGTALFVPKGVEFVGAMVASKTEQPQAFFSRMELVGSDIRSSSRVGNVLGYPTQQVGATGRRVFGFARGVGVQARDAPAITTGGILAAEFSGWGLGRLVQGGANWVAGREASKYAVGSIEGFNAAARASGRVNKITGALGIGSIAFFERNKTPEEVGRDFVFIGPGAFGAARGAARGVKASVRVSPIGETRLVIPRASGAGLRTRLTAYRTESFRVDYEAFGGVKTSENLVRTTFGRVGGRARGPTIPVRFSSFTTTPRVSMARGSFVNAQSYRGAFNIRNEEFSFFQMARGGRQQDFFRTRFTSRENEGVVRSIATTDQFSLLRGRYGYAGSDIITSDVRYADLGSFSRGVGVESRPVRFRSTKPLPGPSFTEPFAFGGRFGMGRRGQIAISRPGTFNENFRDFSGLGTQSISPEAPPVGVTRLSPFGPSGSSTPRVTLPSFGFGVPRLSTGASLLSFPLPRASAFSGGLSSTLNPVRIGNLVGAGPAARSTPDGLITGVTGTTPSYTPTSSSLVGVDTVPDFFPTTPPFLPRGPGPSPPIEPSFPPGMPGLGIPLFGAGKGRGVEGRGKGRSFRYAPSFNAVLFNIKGRRPTGPLGGFETRPLLRGRR